MTKTIAGQADGDAVSTPFSALLQPIQSDIFLNLNRETGGLTVTSMDEDFELLVDDNFRNVNSAKLRKIRLDRVNRIIDSRFTSEIPDWRVSSLSEDVPAGRNFTSEWTLEDGNTLFVAGHSSNDELPMTLTYVCPVEGSDISVIPGQTYCFQASIGLHRARATMRIIFKNGLGEVIDNAETMIDTKAKGGRKLSDYVQRHVVAKAPEDARTLRVEIVKGLTSPGDKDSFLFFTRPALCRSPVAAGYEHLINDLPEELVLSAFSRDGDSLFSGDFPIPDEALDGGLHRVTAKNRRTGAMSSVPVTLPDSVRSSAVIYGLEGSVLIADLKLPGSWKTPIAISLWIDGKPTNEKFRTEPGTGKLRLPLPLSACDGCPHVLELRLGISGQSLGQYALMGPVSVIPWDALQRYAGMPLPSHISPLASYRYPSLAEAATKPPREAGVPLSELHDILAQGFEIPRREFRQLPFPRIKNPDVSIVIPVHNKFDVTYVCLAALLFAVSKATFEVIVVDDGSKDTTVLLPEIAPGVVYVRNDTALGFIGACNAGAGKASGRYIVFLNNDTEPTANWLDELLFTFENFDDVGLAGSKLIYPDGRLQEAGGIVWGTGDPWNYGRGANAHDPRYSYSRVCDYLSGAAVMIPAGLWKEVGGFSPEFMPAYFEDTDLAFKVKRAGKKVVYVPRSVVVHYEGISNGTDQTASSGFKRFQEVNRPKFKRKWASLFAGNGKVGENLDLAKDRGVSKRVLFVDYEVPQFDRDAGSYAAIQEIRMFQALGCKVTYLPLNMAYMGRHTDFLQRLGIEVIYSPFHSSFASFMQSRAAEFDLIYITRYGVAEHVTPLINEHGPNAKRVINVADLHFLRQIRDAIAEPNAGKMQDALLTRDAEIAALSRAELILTYSPIEQAIITSHITHGPKAGIVPWVIDPIPVTVPFTDRKDIVFVGGYRHYPNVNAMKYFVAEVMPLLREAIPGIKLRMYGSSVTPEVEALASADVIVEGYVADIADVFQSCRIFIAPLLTGAGMKGKVLDCIAAGIPSVLSPVAAEGIGIRDGMDAIIARHPADWVKAIAGLYNDEAAWNAMSKNAHALARQLYSFKAGVAALNEALSSIEFYTHGEPALVVNTSRPAAPGHIRTQAKSARSVLARHVK